MYVRQGEAKGLDYAILSAKPCIGDNPFAVVLAEVILDSYSAEQRTET